jgi:AcrR family transcriptional regulator
MATRIVDHPKSAEQSSARDRLLSAADELFYEEGVHSVGIDRVIERAGVAKATLYTAFGSKEGLIGAYLAGRHEARKARVTKALAALGTPREKILGVFDVLGGVIAQTGFRGCAFLNASAESRPGGVVEEICDEYRGWLRTLFLDLGQAAGVSDVGLLAEQLVVLYDGATTGARMDRNPEAAAVARDIAAILIDAAIAPRSRLGPLGPEAIVESAAGRRRDGVKDRRWSSDAQGF